MSIIDQVAANEEVAHRLKMAIKEAKQFENGPLQETVRTNFLSTLMVMAESSAIIGANASRAASTVIRGIVQDSFSLGSIGVYLPRLIFLDGPTQFIEMLRLVRTNQIQIPRVKHLLKIHPLLSIYQCKLLFLNFRTLIVQWIL